jgi:hypothetical protein
MAGIAAKRMITDKFWHTLLIKKNHLLYRSAKHNAAIPKEDVFMASTERLCQLCFDLKKRKRKCLESVKKEKPSVLER